MKVVFTSNYGTEVAMAIKKDSINFQKQQVVLTASWGTTYKIPIGAIIRFIRE